MKIKEINMFENISHQKSMLISLSKEQPPNHNDQAIPPKRRAYMARPRRVELLTSRSVV